MQPDKDSSSASDASVAAARKRSSMSFVKSGGAVALVDTITYTRHLRQTNNKPWFIIDPRKSKLMERWDILTGALV